MYVPSPVLLIIYLIIIIFIYITFNLNNKCLTIIGNWEHEINKHFNHYKQINKLKRVYFCFGNNAHVY